MKKNQWELLKNELKSTSQQICLDTLGSDMLKWELSELEDKSEEIIHITTCRDASVEDIVNRLRAMGNKLRWSIICLLFPIPERDEREKMSERNISRGNG